jgi:hypothetical protein
MNWLYRKKRRMTIIAWKYHCVGKTITKPFINNVHEIWLVEKGGGGICRILFIVCSSLIWSNQEISEFTTLYMRQAFLIIHTFVDCFYVEIQVKWPHWDKWILILLQWRNGNTDCLVVSTIVKHVFFAYIVPCYVFGKNAEKVGESCIVCGWHCIFLFWISTPSLKSED